MELHDLASEVIKKSDKKTQLSIVMEELAEMIQAVSKFNRYGDDHAKKDLIVEMLDCLFMFEQVKIIAGIHDLEIYAREKELVDKIKEVWKID